MNALLVLRGAVTAMVMLLGGCFTTCESRRPPEIEEEKVKPYAMPESSRSDLLRALEVSHLGDVEDVFVLRAGTPTSRKELLSKGPDRELRGISLLYMIEWPDQRFIGTEGEVWVEVLFDESGRLAHVASNWVKARRIAAHLLRDSGGGSGGERE